MPSIPRSPAVRRRSLLGAAAAGVLASTLLTAGAGQPALAGPARAGGAPAAASSDYFIYTHGYLSDSIYGYRASDDTAPRLLREQPWIAGNAGWPVTASPDGRFLYVGAGLTPRLFVYAIGRDGQLTLLDGMPMALQDNPVDILFTPDGRHAFVTMGVLNEQIQPYSIGVDGRPVPNGPAVSMGTLTDGLTSGVVSPDGRNLYVASYFQNQLARFAIRKDGTLAARERISTKAGPIYPIITPDGEHLYVSDERNATLTGYSVATDGQLSELPSSPFPSGPLPHVSDMTPDGRFFYVPGGGITGYEIGADGALRKIASAPDSSDFGSELCVVSPSGDVLWVYGASTLESGGTVELRKFLIQDDGSLVADRSATVDTETMAADGRGVALVPARG
jgi:6-phosphogluconolactonase